jgi:hypothetical protein
MGQTPAKVSLTTGPPSDGLDMEICLEKPKIGDQKLPDYKTVSPTNDLHSQGSGAVKLHDQAFGYPLG